MILNFELDAEGIKTAIHDDHRAAYGLRGVRGEPLQRADQLIGLEETTIGRVLENRVRAGRQRAVGVGQQGAVLVR